MPANTSPIWSKQGRTTSATLTTGTALYDGTSSSEVFAPDTNGGFCEKLMCIPLGTNVATVLRVFIKVASTYTLLTERSLPATTASSTAGQTPIPVAINMVVDPGKKLAVTLGTTVAAGWQVTGVGGDY
jgi:hypothetical protein